MTKELLNEFDHRQKLSDRYYEESKDTRIEKMKASIDFKDDPIDCIPDPGPSVHELAFDQGVLEPVLDTLREAIEALDASQQDLIWDLFGCCKSMEEVAKEHGVTRQAIYSRKMKIIKKLRKMLEE